MGRATTSLDRKFRMLQMKGMGEKGGIENMFVYVEKGEEEMEEEDLYPPSMPYPRSSDGRIDDVHVFEHVGDGKDNASVVKGFLRNLSEISLTLSTSLFVLFACLFVLGYSPDHNFQLEQFIFN